MTASDADSDAASSDLAPSWPITDDAIRDLFESMLQDGSWGRYHGPHCDRLRKSLAEYHGVEHVILCSSGTSAVELALRAVKVQADDEVVLAAYDYKANFANVLTLNATPVLVDTLPGIPALDPKRLKEAITTKTRAIVCSHLHGCFARMDAINAVAAEFSIPVIEDACQAAGGMLNGQPVASIGDMGVLSFGGSKPLTAGRGGAVLTNNAMLAQRIKLYTQRGNDAYPLSEMQAAVLLPQLQQLPERTRVRLENAKTLVTALTPSDWLEDSALEDSDGSIPAFYKLALQFSPQTQQPTMTREDFSAAARQAGVALAPAFPALHLIHSKRRFRSAGPLQNAEDLHHNLMTLHHPVLLHSDRIDVVANVIRNIGR